MPEHHRNRPVIDREVLPDLVGLGQAKRAVAVAVLDDEIEAEATGRIRICDDEIVLAVAVEVIEQDRARCLAKPCTGLTASTSGR